MDKQIILALIFPLFWLMSDCKHPDKQGDNSQIAQYNEPLIKINRYLIKKDVETIEKTIKKRKWKMNASKTGLYSEIYFPGNGIRVKTGDIVLLKYKVDLLDGTPCYNSDKLGLKTFKVGQGGVENGLEEAVLLLRQGDKARFILLPHLAHGLIGDQDKIPARSTIVYDLELIKVNKGGK